MKSFEIRQSFLDFFASKQHQIVPSCSLLPEAPNLLFTNAGMNPFVPYFLGERNAKYKRVADTQKCIRAGGKHNDLEEVGFDTYHHTFFEMLGNWSFGDYFKKEAIAWAWELLTQVWHLPKERLYATIYAPQEGDPAEFDQEAYDEWAEIFKKEGLDPKTHIVFGNKKDNFWMMGDTGPCGPCSEIHIDLTPQGDTQGRLVNAGDARCMEIWNLVFMQYNALPNGQFELLKNRYVDTGMGLERLAGIWETSRGFKDFTNVPSNYSSDLFTPIFEQLEHLSGHHYQGLVVEDADKKTDINTLKDCAFRIIADHIRTLTFAIADGILPGNEGRNYVLRRIIRRAILFGQRLDLPRSFFSELSSVVVEEMGGFFPELVRNAAMVKKVLKSEEDAFELTLQKGLHLLEKWMQDVYKISGEQAFLLYDTYGFPLDLTVLLAKEYNLEVDVKSFEQCMKQQKERSKAASKKEVVEVLNDQVQSTVFCGYDLKNLSYQTKLLKVSEKDGKTFLITQETPFYAEKGGQVCDRGFAEIDGKRFKVIDVRWHGNTIVHTLDGILTDVSCDKTITLEVDEDYRLAVARHHTATHLLQWALRSVLGEHVKQAGSFVNDQQLRLDITHFEKISQEDLDKVAQLCYAKILENCAVTTEEIDFENRPKDCLAFFGDKYGDRVRVVRIGDFSTELCGGTHAKATGDLGLFVIKQETGIAAGVRRIEACVGESAYRYWQNYERVLWNLEKELNCSSDLLLKRYNNLEQEYAQLEKRYRQLVQKNATQMVVEQKNIADLICVRLDLQAGDMSVIKTLGKQYIHEKNPDVLLVFANEMDKAFCGVFCSAEAIQRGLSATQLIKAILQPLGASGGGKPDFASGGVKNVQALKDYLTTFAFDKYINL